MIHNASALSHASGTVCNPHAVGPYLATMGQSDTTLKLGMQHSAFHAIQRAIAIRPSSSQLYQGGMAMM